LEVVSYSESHRNEWEAFVNSAINGNFLHTRAFYDQNTQNDVDDASLLFYRKGKLAAVLPAVLYASDGKMILNSHLRSTYGGYIISRKMGMTDAVEMVNATLDFACSKNVNEIIIRNPFRILYDTLSDESDYAMWRCGFKIKYREVETYIDLRPPLDQIKKEFDKGTKYNTIKAWKTVTVKESEDFGGFWDMLTENLQSKFGKAPVHTAAQMLALRATVGNDNIKLMGAYLDDKLIGGCVLFVFKNALHAQYIAQDNAYQEHRCINAVTDYIIDWGKKNNYSFFNLGTGNDKQGMFINEGLTHFKESFGGRGVLRETMHIEL
jgi:hypothetical protein